MPDLRTIAKDPDFQLLPIEEKVKAFSEYDKDFASLSDTEKVKGVNELTGIKTSQPPTTEAPVSWRDQMRMTREKAQAGFRSDLLNLLSFAGKPQEAGQMLGAALATPSGREELIKPITESIANPRGIPERISAYATEHPLNTALNILPFAGLATKAGALTRAAAESKLAGALESPASAILAADKYSAALPELRSVVTKGMEKGVRPSVAGKSTFPQMHKYYEQAESGVKSIINNKGNLEYVSDTGEVKRGQVPQSLVEFSDAIHQTKKSIFERYDALAKQTGDTPLRINLNSIANELDATQSSPQIRLNHPETAKYVDDMAKRYREIGSLSPVEAQEVIADLNNSLKAFYRNPSYDTASKAATDAMVANKLRRGLDNAISEATGPGYQQLKNEYGSLSTIEKDVTHRTVVDARKNIRGLIDFSNIWSGAELATGIMTLNPVHIGRAAIIEGIRKYTKHINDPNRIISNMFKDAEKVYTPEWIGQSTPLRDIPVSDQLGLPAGPERKLLNAPGAVNPEFTMRPSGMIPPQLPESPETFLRAKLLESEAKRIAGENPEKLTTSTISESEKVSPAPSGEAVKGKEPWEMTKEEFIANPSPGYEYVSDRPFSARRQERGLTRVSDDFFKGTPESRKALILHEEGHDLVKDFPKDFKDVFDPLKIKGKIDQYENPFGFKQNPEEIIADTYASLFEPFPYEKGGKFDLLRERVAKIAIREGKSVPPEVLKDYPDLAAPKPPIAEPGKVGVKKPEGTILTWLKDQGGINDKDYNEVFSSKESGLIGLVNKQSGKSMDVLATNAKDYGWQGISGPEDLYRALTGEKKTILPGTEEVVGAKLAKEKAKPIRPEEQEGFFELKAKEELRAGDLNKGDEIIIKGEKYKHRGFDSEGKAIIEDGEKYRLDPWDKIEADAVKKGEIDLQNQILEQIKKENPEEYSRILKGNTAQLIQEWLAKRLGKSKQMRQGEIFQSPKKQGTMF